MRSGKNPIGLQFQHPPLPHPTHGQLCAAWRELRARLADTEPTKFESRTEFIARLRRAVAWINNHRAEYLKNLCMSQKERASDVLDAKGARTRH